MYFQSSSLLTRHLLFFKLNSASDHCFKSAKWIPERPLCIQLNLRPFILSSRVAPVIPRASLVIWFKCVVLAYRGHTGTLKLDKLINGPKQNQFGNQVSFHRNYRVKRSSSWFRSFPDTTVQRRTLWQGFAFSIGQICLKLCYLIIKRKSALGLKHFSIRWGSIIWCKPVACSAMSSVTSSQTFIKYLFAGKIFHALKRLFQLNFKGSLEITCWWIDFSKKLRQNETGRAIRPSNKRSH